MKTVLVTGGSKGIGKEIVYAFAAAGYNVILNYNSSEQSAKTIAKDLESCKGIVEPYKADVTNRFEVNEMVEYAFKEFGNVDVLVNNAGVSNICMFQDITEEVFDRVLDVNLKGTFNVTQAVLKQGMLEAKQGAIINISSIWGVTGGSCETIYSASKAGVIGLTKALAKELAPSNISVNAIAPGTIATEMITKNYSVNEIKEFTKEIPMGRMGKPKEIASLVMFLASDDAKYITGQVISPNGGLMI